MKHFIELLIITFVLSDALFLLTMFLLSVRKLRNCDSRIGVSLVLSNVLMLALVIASFSWDTINSSQFPYLVRVAITCAILLSSNYAILRLRKRCP